MLPPPFAAAMEATADPFFQPILDLDLPRLVAERVALLGDVAFVALPHVVAGVTKAALNATWLAEALADRPRDPPVDWGVSGGPCAHGHRTGAAVADAGSGGTAARNHRIRQLSRGYRGGMMIGRIDEESA